MRRIAAAFLLVSATFTVPGGGIPTIHATLPPDDGLVAPAPPTVTAGSWILYDATFGQVLAEQEADVQRAVASTTKIMTALVVLEEAKPDDLVQITERAALVGESEIGLSAREPPWTVEDMLAALLLHSANDSAVALAEHVAGSVEGFADLMNAKAAGLGLENSNFANPHGLDQRNHYSSARDLLTVALAAMEDPLFARLVRTRSANLPTTPEDEPRVALNRNQLLATYPGAIGVKTGYTDKAVLTLVAAAERDRRRIYAVVLGSSDHFGDAIALLDYGFAEFAAMTLVPATSEERRPLAGTLDGPADEDFELFIVEAPEEVVVVSEQDPVPEPGEPPADPEVKEEPVVVVVREFERRPELPGLDDALAWAGRYWDWILGKI